MPTRNGPDASDSHPSLRAWASRRGRQSLSQAAGWSANPGSFAVAAARASRRRAGVRTSHDGRTLEVFRAASTRLVGPRRAFAKANLIGLGGVSLLMLSLSPFR